MRRSLRTGRWLRWHLRIRKDEERIVMEDNKILIEEIVPESTGDNGIGLLWKNGTVCGVGCSNAGSTCGLGCS